MRSFQLKCIKCEASVKKRGQKIQKRSEDTDSPLVTDGITHDEFNMFFQQIFHSKLKPEIVHADRGMLIVVFTEKSFIWISTVNVTENDH